MMIAFKCKRSGNLVAFSDLDDIESMRKESGYVEVKEQSNETALPVVVEQPKTRGRPRKGKADAAE